MERNIQNVSEIKEETNVDKVNRMLKDGWIVIATTKTTYIEDGPSETITYHLGRLIEE